MNVTIRNESGVIEPREISDPSQVYGLHVVGYMSQQPVADTELNREIMRAIDLRIASRKPTLGAQNA